MIEGFLEITIEATLLLALAFVVTGLMRGTSAAARHLVWSAAIVGVLALPALEVAVPWHVGIVPSIGEGSVPVEPSRVEPSRERVEPALAGGRTTFSPGGIERTAQPVDASATAPPKATGVEATATAAEAVSIPTAVDWSWSRLALFAWLLGVLFVIGRLLLSSVSAWFLARRAEPVTSRDWYGPLGAVTGRLALRTPVRLVRSKRTAMPITTGVLRPAVVLPAGSGRWSEERRQAVLLHELAHVRRYDVLVHWLAWIACAVYWFHPLVWIAATRLRHESERACDDLVLESGTRPSAYAEHLLEIVRTAGLGRAPALAMPMAQRSKFEGRLLAILEPDVTRGSASRFRAAGALLAVVLVTVPLAAMGPASPGSESVEITGSADSGEEAEVTLDVERDTRIRKVEAEMPILSAGPISGGVSGSEISEIQLAESESRPAERERNAEAGEASQESAKADAARRVGALVPVLRDEDAEVRTGAARALGELGDPRSVEALSRALRQDDSPDVRRTAAWALGEIEDPAAIPALAHAIRNDAVVEVRKMAAWALGEIESPDGVGPLGDALEDSSVEVRRMAIWGLGEIEHPRAVPWIVPALGDADAGIRQKAAWALGEIESAEAVDPLGKAIDDEDAEVRMTVVWALGEIEDARAVPWLERAIDDPSPGVRKKAVWALGEIESVQAVGPLSRALADGDPEVRKSAAWAIGEIQPGAAPRALLEATGDENREVRKTAAWALGEIEDPAAIPALRGLLDDADRDVKKTALWALMEMDDDVAYDTLIRLLEDDDPEVRKQAARALGERD